MSKNPIVSIVIPTCDRPKYLKNAIESVHRQTVRDIEVIVVNDGKLKLRDLPFIRDVKLLEGHTGSKKALGYGSGGYTRNIGLQAARGKFVCFLDDDDQFESNKLETQITQARKEGARALCSNAYIGIFPTRLPFSTNLHDSYYKKQLEPTLSSLNLKALPERFDIKLLSRHNTVITSSTFIERDLLISAGGFHNIANGGQLIEGRLDYEDWEFWRRIAEIESFSYNKAPLLYYKRGSLKKLRTKILRKLHLAPQRPVYHGGRIEN